MTHIATTLPIIVREFRLPRIHRPRLQIGATLGFLFRAHAQVLEVACLAPVTRSDTKPAMEPSEGQDGRDPNW